MAEPVRRSSLSAFITAVREPQIVLASLTRLRWLAVVGQITATGVAVGALRLRLPLGPIGGIILLTAVSNVLLMWVASWRKSIGWTIPAAILLDVLLLTSLLYLTGGPKNPFAALYLIHVAMAVIVLRAAWTWGVVASVSACYGILLSWHLPLVGGDDLPSRVWAIGNWLALVLVAILITVFIGQVIHSLRLREAELATVRERAGKSEQLAALTTLAAGAAHELNTPLGTIAVVAKELELSRDPVSADDPVIEDARLIRREVDRCRNILSRMRVDIGEDVSHRSVIDLFDLEAHLRDSLREDETPRLAITRAPDVRTVRAPQRALEQALLVLLRNAFDASPPDAPVALGVTRSNGRVRFEVRDRGSGMSEEMLRHAGEPFFTTKEPGRGMGLGLFLVRLVADQCGATFTIDSHVGAGTTCVLELSEPRIERTAPGEQNSIVVASGDKRMA